ncbi:hypothetical protein MNBD_GAMMA12-840 [hydrothermal vent metagenome]|uniref:DUF4440 domain-containing protein n=1 Tax=hydrothermal vent metagenome TaxID=652676 RepID=A0A3B0YI84_9ZZZZ
MGVLLEIEACESKLQQAMLESDVAVLDKLLSSQLIFTNHLGQLMGKQDDLEAHQSGIFKIKEIVCTEQKIKLIHDIAVVTVKCGIAGNYSGTMMKNKFRFTRVWERVSNHSWQLVVAHSTLIAKEK